MTIEDSEAVDFADPQDSKNGGPSSSKDDLESLVRLLANQSTQLAERVALLEGERREDQRSKVDAPDGGGTKIQRIGQREKKRYFGNNTPSTASLRDKDESQSNNNEDQIRDQAQ